MAFNEVVTLTSVPEVSARVEPGERLTLSTGLATQLGLVHRLEHRLYGGPAARGPSSAMAASVDAALGELGFAEPGTSLRRRSPLAKRSLDGAVFFFEADVAQVESLTRDELDLPKGAEARHVLVVRWEDALVPGDSVSLDGQPFVVEALVPDEARWVRGPAFSSGEAVVTRVVPTAAQRAIARSIGPYSLITQRPLSPAVTISMAQLRHLTARGCLATVSEVVTTRSESPMLRLRAYENLVKRERVPDPIAERRPSPRQPLLSSSPARVPDIFSFFAPPSDADLTEVLPTLHAATAEAFACGFELGLTLTRLSLGVARLGDGADWSHGEVKKPETINYRTHLPEPDGLFCQRIFGPVKDYQCACGLLTQMKNRGLTCEKCGVEVLQSKVRRARFGHVVLACPVVPKPFELLVAQLLDEPPSETRARLINEGGALVAEQLAAVDVRGIVAGLPDGPLRTRLAGFAETGLPCGELLWRIVPVLPPELRPLVPLDRGRFATSDLNDLYRRLINRNNRLRRLTELQAPEIIIQNERRQLMQAVDHLIDNTRAPRITGPNRRPLVSMREVFVSHLQPVETRRVDYAASLVTVVDEGLSGNQVRASDEALAELLRPRLFGLLEERGLVTTIREAKRLVDTDAELRRTLVAELASKLPWLLMHADASRPPLVTTVFPAPSREPTICISRELAARFEARSGDALALHLPACDEAVSEARWLASGATGQLRNVPLAGPSVTELVSDSTDFWDRLVDAAIEGRSDDGRSVETAVLVGGFDLADHPRLFGW